MFDEKEYHKEYDRVYYQKNKEKILKRCREYSHKNKEKIQKYNKDNKKHISGMYREWYQKNKENQRIYGREWYQKNKENRREYSEKYREKIKTKVFNLLSDNDPHCVRCGCDDIRLLEINHKNGGGYEEMKKEANGSEILWNIYMGRRKITDLEILCKVCNAHHYLELKYGKLPYKVSYEKKRKGKDENIFSYFISITYGGNIKVQL